MRALPMVLAALAAAAALPCGAQTPSVADLFIRPEKGHCIACHQVPEGSGPQTGADVGPRLEGSRMRALGKKAIRDVIVDPNRVFYDPNTSPHYHIYDVETGGLTDIDAAAVRIEGLPELPGMTTEGMDIIIRVRRIEKA